MHRALDFVFAHMMICFDVWWFQLDVILLLKIKVASVPKKGIFGRFLQWRRKKMGGGGGGGDGAGRQQTRNLCTKNPELLKLHIYLVYEKCQIIVCHIAPPPPTPRPTPCYSTFNFSANKNRKQNRNSTLFVQTETETEAKFHNRTSLVSGHIN